MKKIIVICFHFLGSLTVAQTEQQNIELPDFVITGKQSIQVQTAAKPKPEYISVISKDFLMPQYSPEELPLLISSVPVPIQPSIKSSHQIFLNNIILSAGKNSLPIGRLHFTQSYENYLFSFSAWGSNIREYLPKAGYNDSGFEMEHDVFISTRSDFLPGAKIKIGADYWRDSYKFFASKNPDYLRETNNGSAFFSFESKNGRWINFGLDANGGLISLKENGFKETNLISNAFLEFKWNNQSFGAKGKLHNQLLANSLSGKNSYNFFAGEAFYKNFSSDIFWFTVGAAYAMQNGNKFLTPTAAVEMKFNDNITAGVEYKPHAEFFTVKDFLKKNYYYILGLTDNILTEVKLDFNGIVKYEFEKQFSVSLSTGFSKADGYFYFEDFKDQGMFDLFTFNGARIIKSKLDIFFHPNQFGSFYGELQFKSVKDQNDKKIPYEPSLSSTLRYNYNFIFGFGFSISYKTATGIYTNIANTNKLPDFHDISLSFSKEILKGLKVTADFQNILNRNNFVYRLYQEKPFDYLLGIDYSW